MVVLAYLVLVPLGLAIGFIWSEVLVRWLLGPSEDA